MATVNFAVAFNDNCVGGSVSLTAGLASGSAFPGGTTVVAFTATDASGIPPLAHSR
ncbi:MAG: hypothetical protein U0176_11625 [Bacteroidia bacterium]